MKNFKIDFSYYYTESDTYQQPKKRKSTKHDQLAARVELTLSLCLGEELLGVVQQGDLNRVRSLLQRGANLKVKNDAGWNVLTWAAIHGNTEIARLLIEAGADVNDKDNSGWPPHIWAAVYGHSPVCKLLIDKGADPNFQDKDGWTPLIYAGRYGHVEIGRNLIEWGTKYNHEDSYGCTALMRACYYEHVEFVRMLLERGADPNRRTSKSQSWLGIGVGWTALMIAAAKNTKPVIANLLLQNGARLDDENSNNEKAVDLATNENIRKFIQNAPPIVRGPRPLTI